MRSRPTPLLFFVLLFLIAACSPIGGGNSATPTPAVKLTPTLQPVLTATTANTAVDACPVAIANNPDCYTPHALRVAYDVEALTEKGFTGKGITVIDIVSYGSPTLQQDMDVFDKQFGLPPIHIQVYSPLGTVPFNPNMPDMTGWALETELDVQIIHAIAPGAGIVVMTSPVDETEGTIGMPEFMKLEQYAVDHHLGQIFSQSYVASEPTLSDSQGQQLVNSYAAFYQQITTRQGFTVLSGSGDNGATDWENIAATRLSPTPAVNFPADVPWVTAVGGTVLRKVGDSYDETAWSGSGGGVSKFFAEPDFQKSIQQPAQGQLGGHRGIPDVAADAEAMTGMAFYIHGIWGQVGGTSASTPLWAGLIAIADQMAGYPLGFINPGIYKVATSPNAQRDFRDITSGSNAVHTSSVQIAGFQATAGWDAVTGWGSPLASQLIPDLIAALK
jgi:subtilase family serine protease